MRRVDLDANQFERAVGQMLAYYAKVINGGSALDQAQYKYYKGLALDAYKTLSLDLAEITVPDEKFGAPELEYNDAY
jgi:hypothetical protein